VGCPNAAALALAPLEWNVGSASFLLGFLQIGVSGLAFASIGLVSLNLVIAATSWTDLAILIIGKPTLECNTTWRDGRAVGRVPFFHTVVRKPPGAGRWREEFVNRAGIRGRGSNRWRERAMPPRPGAAHGG
jgi:hypothetical protein